MVKLRAHGLQLQLGEMARLASASCLLLSKVYAKLVKMRFKRLETNSLIQW